MNYRALEHRAKAIGAIVALVTDLVVSEPTFQRDYEARFGEITCQRALFDGANYPQLVAQLRERRRVP